ncbi:hypothetical protein MBLNU13_g05808t1 [Cladosporium sp. NU13]
MARERRPPSARSRDTANTKQAKDAVETRDPNVKPATKKDDLSHKTGSPAGDETNKNDEHEQSSSSQVEDNRTFQQLVHDYGDDMLNLNELFHAQPSDRNVEVKPETDKGK